jgi:transcriptional regulator with XRE-family HTH domain
MTAPRGERVPRLRPEDRELGDPRDEYALEVGRRIVQARKEKNMTQVELARKIGVSQRSAQAYENGEVIPYRQLKKLSRALGRPQEWILHGEDGDGAGTGAVSEGLASLERKVDDLTRLLNGLVDKIDP